MVVVTESWMSQWLVARAGVRPHAAHPGPQQGEDLEAQAWGDRRHPLLPRLLAHHGNLFDIATMFGCKFDVFPDRAHIPAMEIVHDEQDFDFCFHVYIIQKFHC